jgi:Ca2+-binding EF-hand superfamily protein
VEICLYAKFDTDGNGTLDYKEFVSHFVEGEYLHLGFSSLPDAEVRQLQQANAPEDDALMKMKVKLSDRFRQLTGIDAGERLKDAFAAVDPSRTGAVSKAYFTIIMDQMNLKFSDMEMECIENVFKTESGDISYVEFANQLCVKREETVMGRTSYKRSMNRYFQERC